MTNSATSASQKTATNSSGVYQVLQLPIGLYRVTVAAPGFQQTTVDSKTALQINETLRIDVTLEVGKLSDTVTVESNASQVETENSTISATVTGQAIFELPLNGRNTLDLLKTQPGISATNPDSTAAGSYSIGGMRTDSVTYVLDGGLNNDLLDNGVVANPNPDAVAEFRVLENNYSAEYGRNAGGIVSVVTKSGTNQFHGTAFDYVRNNFFDANTFFNNQQNLPVPVLKRNQFGGTVGGPIVKNKLFFFFSYEGQRQSSIDVSPGKVTAFTPAEANGDFSQSSGQANVSCFLTGVTGCPLDNNGKPITLGPNPYYQSNPALAAQGIINPAKIDPVAKAYLAAGLLPVSRSGFLFPQGSAKNNFDEYLGKIDYTITDRDTITGTFTSNTTRHLSIWFNGVNNSASSPPYNVYGFPVPIQQRLILDRLPTHTPSPRRYSMSFASRLNGCSTIRLSRFDKPYGSRARRKSTVRPADGSTATLLPGSGVTTGPSHQGPTVEADNTYQFTDNLSWSKGSHNLKFGFSFSAYQNNTIYDFVINGAYYFYGPSTSVGSGLDLADFLMGNPDEYTQSPKAPSNIRSHQYAGFGQDTWHATKNLTLTFGLRYEYAQPKYDTQGRTFSFIPGLQSQRFPNSPPGLVYPGDPGAPTGSNFPDKTNFSPRFGFAYDVFGNAKTSLRGGFGMFYDILKGEDNLQFNGQPPFFAYADIYPTTYTGIGPSGLQDPFASAGATNPFPSKPPAKDINFADCRLSSLRRWRHLPGRPESENPVCVPIQHVHTAAASLEYAAGGGLPGYSAHGLTSLVDVNPYPMGGADRIYGTTTTAIYGEFQNVSRASYNGLEINLTRRFSDSRFGSSFFTVAYTLGHEIDNVSGFRQRNSEIPAYDHELFRASGDTDVRNTFALSGGWDLPFDKLWERGPKLLTRGWSLYPILTMRSGFPLDVFANLNTTSSDRVLPVPATPAWFTQIW